MGLDLCIAIQLTDHQLAHLPGNINVRPINGESPLDEDSQGHLDHLKVYDNGGNWYSVNTLLRWYGPGYKRGHWPTTRALITSVLNVSDIVVVRYEELWYIDARLALIEGDHAYVDGSPGWGQHGA